MSDLQQILTVLGIIQNDIKALKTGQDELRVGQGELRAGLEELKLGQEAIKLDQEAMKIELRTMQEGTSHSLDGLSTQFIGVVQDFDKLGNKLHTSFEKWSDQAHSVVVDKVLAVQGPRIKAMENRFHGIKACTW
jgi:hypothetical protein